MPAPIAAPVSCCLHAERSALLDTTTLLRPQGAHAHLEYISLRVKSCVRVINKELELQMDIRELEDALLKTYKKLGHLRR